MSGKSEKSTVAWAKTGVTGLDEVLSVSSVTRDHHGRSKQHGTGGSSKVVERCERTIVAQPVSISPHIQ